MPSPLVVARFILATATPSHAFDTMLHAPLTTILRRWHGPIGPVKEVVDQTPDWGQVGASRTLMQAGGGSMREELTNVHAPDRFDYALTDITGPLSHLVDHVEGTWTFDPAGPQTRIAWQWTLHPRTRLTAQMLPVFTVLWRGYAGKALAELVTQLKP